jgi:predicted nucleic acid-binding Zn ribbon protein
VTSDETPDDASAGAPEPGSDQAEEHADDGLDLARRAARAAAGSGQPASSRRRRAKVARDVRAPRAPLSGAHPDDRDPQPLDTTVGRFVADRGWDLDLRVHGVFVRWAELVGAEVAAHTTPESFADGTLVVRTDSTAWATQLRYLAPTLLRRLNEELGHGTVTLIDVLGPTAPSWKKGPRSVRDGRGPRDTYG